MWSSWLSGGSRPPTGGWCEVFAHEVADDASGWRASGGGWFGAH